MQATRKMLTGGSIRMAQKMLHGGSMCAAPWFRERDMNESTINDPVQMEYASETPIQDKAGDKKAMTFRQIYSLQYSLLCCRSFFSLREAMPGSGFCARLQLSQLSYCLFWHLNFRPTLLPMRLLSQEQLSHFYAYGLCPL